MSKAYTMYCITKAGGNQYLHSRVIVAETQKDAKVGMKHLIEDTLGRHAFSVDTKPGGDWDWEYIADAYGKELYEIKKLALQPDGFCFYPIIPSEWKES